MKNTNSDLFTSERNLNKMISKETPPMNVNKRITCVSNRSTLKPNIPSHTVQIVFITKLGKETSDIEFVRQSIGSSKIDTTSRSIKYLS